MKDFSFVSQVWNGQPEQMKGFAMSDMAGDKSYCVSQDSSGNGAAAMQEV